MWVSTIFFQNEPCSVVCAGFTPGPPTADVGSIAYTRGALSWILKICCIHFTPVVAKLWRDCISIKQLHWKIAVSTSFLMQSNGSGIQCYRVGRRSFSPILIVPVQIESRCKTSHKPLLRNFFLPVIKWHCDSSMSEWSQTQLSIVFLFKAFTDSKFAFNLQANGSQ
jgi:hypothetical protein